MIENFYLFSDLNRDSKMWTMEQAFDTPNSRIIAMDDDEDAYLFSMQLMLGAHTIIPFQKWHDDLWALNKDKPSIRAWMQGIVYCTDPNLLDYMLSYRGDLDQQKRHREKKHWSKIDHQISLNGPFSI